MNKYEKHLREVLNSAISWKEFSNKIEELSVLYNIPLDRVMKDLERILSSDS